MSENKNEVISTQNLHERGVEASKKPNNDFFDPVDQTINKDPEQYKKDKKQAKAEKKAKKKAQGPWYKRMSHGFKKWFYGVGKEFRRISWLPKNHIFRDFLVVLIICVFLALLFLAIDMILISI